MGCSLNEAAFLTREGAFQILDLLEISPVALRNLLLGCLLDIGENPKALLHIQSWQGQKMPLLCGGLG